MKPICVKCEVVLDCIAGVVVVENASFGPYKIWNADLHRCPICKLEVVSGFGQHPVIQHYEEGFAQYLEQIKASSTRVINWNERE